MTLAHSPETTNPEDIVWSLPEQSTADTALLVLPHAGGNAHAYAEWRDHLPAGVRLLIGQYPGRGARFADPLPLSVDDLAGPVVDSIPDGIPNLVVLGHSMGSLVAFEVARRLTARGTPPRALIASAARAPHLPNQAPVHPELLDDDALVAAIKARGGTQDGILDEPELREIVLPAIRADFAIDDAYQHTGPTGLTCPITVIGGTEDPIVPVDVLGTWATATSSAVAVETLPGDHFYFQQQLPRFLALVTAVIDAATRP
ncbi:thioesterase II family protein [Actinokineospora soli]|uniref:Thioesterase II family protein n=1 Tax=Actinokineospora soli TaxID=1048753 RepID=A0ABW2TSL3_9PSEU